MPINHPVVATAGLMALSMALAAAIAAYESPELRRMSEDLRRRIAIAFSSFGDILTPGDIRAGETLLQREPLFNRPEDAEGFLRSSATGSSIPGRNVGWSGSRDRRRRAEEAGSISRGSGRFSRGWGSFEEGVSCGNTDVGGDRDVELNEMIADDDSLRLQREELLYWNVKQLEAEARALQQAASSTTYSATADTPRVNRSANQSQSQSQSHGSQSSSKSRTSSSFDDFLRPVVRHPAVENDNDSGAFVVSSFSGPQFPQFKSPCRPNLATSSPTHSPGTAANVPEENIGDGNDDEDLMPTPKRRRSAASPLAVETTTQAEVTNQPLLQAIQEWAAASSPSPSTSNSLEFAPTSHLSMYPSFPVPPHTGNPAVIAQHAAAAAPASSGFSDADFVSAGAITPTDTDTFSMVSADVSSYPAAGVTSTAAASSAANARLREHNYDVTSISSTGEFTPSTWSEVGSVISGTEN